MRYPLVQRGLIALVQVLAMGMWFSASAVVPALARQWHMSAGAAAWLTTPVQAGFVAGAIGSAVLGLADRMRPHLLLAGCAPARPGAPAGPAGRALAMGVLIGALTVGSALPHLIGGLWRLDWRAVLAAAAATAFAGAIMAGALIRPGPQVPPAARAGRPRYVLAMFADSGPRLVSLAYFGHMRELYALWTWLPAFLAESSTATTGLPAEAACCLLPPLSFTRRSWKPGPTSRSPSSAPP